MGFVILAVTFGLMWVLFVLPQQRRVRQHQALVAGLEAGEDVVTTAGLYGEIVSLDEETVLLRLDPSGLEVKMARGAIHKRAVEPEPEDVTAGDVEGAEPSEETE